VRLWRLPSTDAPADKPLDIPETGKRFEKPPIPTGDALTAAEIVVREAYKTADGQAPRPQRKASAGGGTAQSALSIRRKTPVVCFVLLREGVRSWPYEGPRPRPGVFKRWMRWTSDFGSTPWSGKAALSKQAGKGGRPGAARNVTIAEGRPSPDWTWAVAADDHEAAARLLRIAESAPARLLGRWDCRTSPSRGKTGWKRIRKRV